MHIEIKAAKRDGQGSGASRRLRHAGRVPGIVYGGDKAPQAIDLEHQELMLGMRQEAFHSSILSLDLEGEKQAVLLKDVQTHPYKPLILHVDFMRVQADEAIHVKVPLHFLNDEQAPGVKLHHGLMSHVMNEVEVVCLPKDLPEFIEVDLGEMELNTSLHLSQLKVPTGLAFAALQRGEDPTVATLLAPIVQAEETAGSAEEGEQD